MFEERGIRTLFLAVGMAHWTETQSAAQPAAPVVLFPLELKARGATAEDFDVKTVGDPQVSPTLLEKLATDFGVRLDAAELDDLLLGTGPPVPATADDHDPVEDPSREAPDGGSGPGPGAGGVADAELLDRLEKEVDGKVPGFLVSERIVIAELLVPQAPDGQGPRGVRAAADRARPRRRDRGRRSGTGGSRATDARSTSTPRCPTCNPRPTSSSSLDSDGTQSYAIDSVVAGGNLVVKGPPGTGKSQTIANLIATLAARRQRVLFVAEKRAAIDAVLKRLDAEDLGHLVMDLHRTARSRRLIAAGPPGRARRASSSTPLVDLTDPAGRARRPPGAPQPLHRGPPSPPRPVGREPLHHLPVPPRDRRRRPHRLPLPGPGAQRPHRRARRRAPRRPSATSSASAASLRPANRGRPRSSRHPTTCVPLDAVTKLKAEVPAWRPVVKRMTDAVGLVRRPRSPTRQRTGRCSIAGVQDTLAVVDEDLFQLDLTNLAAGLDKGWFARIFSGDYRAARKTVRRVLEAASTRWRRRTRSSRP